MVHHIITSCGTDRKTNNIVRLLQLSANVERFWSNITGKSNKILDLCEQSMNDCHTHTNKQKTYPFVNYIILFNAIQYHYSINSTGAVGSRLV